MTDATKRARVLRLALSNRRGWSFPGAPRVTLRRAMDSALRDVEAGTAFGGYCAQPFGMFRERRERDSRWVTDRAPDFVLRDMRDAPARFRDHARNGYCAGDHEGRDEARIPVVARIGTSRRDVVTRKRFGLWVAGYRVEASEGASFDTSRVFWGACDEAPPDAEIAAHDMARRAAEREAEYNEAWQAGRMARDAWDEARGDLESAVLAGRARRNRTRELVAAARMLARAAAKGAAKPGAWRVVMREARATDDARSENAREERAAWHRACDAFRDAAPSRFDRSEEAAGFRDGASMCGDASPFLRALLPREGRV